MTISEIVIWVVLGGAIGGLAELFTELTFGDNERGTNDDLEKGAVKFKYNNNEVSIWQSIVLSLISIMIGVCGSVAFQFILILLGSFKSGKDPEQILFLLSISSAAGFGARRLLPKITSQLENKVAEIEEKNKSQDDELSDVKRKTEQLKKEAERIKSETEHAQFEADEKLLFLQYQDAEREDALFSMRRQCIRELSKFLEIYPKERKYAFRLGRLYKVSGKYLEGIFCMENFANRFEGAKISKDKLDQACALYNKACYATLYYSDSKDENYKKMALNSLKECFSVVETIPEADRKELDYDPKEDAKTDSDFNELRKEKDTTFAKIVEG